MTFFNFEIWSTFFTTFSYLKSRLPKRIRIEEINQEGQRGIRIGIGQGWKMQSHRQIGMESPIPLFIPFLSLHRKYRQIFFDNIFLQIYPQVIYRLINSILTSLPFKPEMMSHPKYRQIFLRQYFTLKYTSQVIRSVC